MFITPQPSNQIQQQTSNNDKKRIHPFAIASLIIGIVGVLTFIVPGLGFILSIPGLIFGIIALIKIPAQNKRGKPLAIIGIVLAVITLLLAIIATAYFMDHSNTTQSNEGNSSSISRPENTNSSSNSSANASSNTSSIAAAFNADDYESVPYDDVARDPSSYDGKLLVFSGEIAQVVEGSTIGMRVAVDSDYNQMIMVTYTPQKSEKRFLENDNVTIYGKCTGLYTYTSVMGAKISIPGMDATKIEAISQEEVAKKQANQYAVSIDSCQLTTNYSGNRVAIINITFTNNSSENIKFTQKLEAMAFQAGIELDSAYISNDDYDSHSAYKEVQPGGSILVQQAFELNSNETIKIEVRTRDYSNPVVIAEREFSVG